MKSKQQTLDEIINWCNERNTEFQLLNENRFFINETNFIFADILIADKLLINLSYQNYEARYNPKNKHFQDRNNSLIKTLNVSLDIWKSNFGNTIYNKQYLIVF